MKDRIYPFESPQLNFEDTQMNEFQLVETYREGFVAVWAQLQWWASISFGLLTLASFGRKHLSLHVTIGLSVLYVTYTFFSLMNSYALLITIVGAVAELGTLENLSIVGTNIINTTDIRILNSLAGMVCFLVTTCGTLAYLWHSHRNSKLAAK